MDRAYMICHILSSLDGKITGDFIRTESTTAVQTEFARLRSEYHADAWIYGTTTTMEFLHGKKAVTEEIPEEEEEPEEDFVARDHFPLYYVSLDVQGEVGWESGIFQRPGRPDEHVIEVLTEETPAAFRRYLQKRGISYITAGKYVLDCQIVAKKLYRLFGIRTALVCGGGVVNWSFLRQGALDELNLVLVPVVDGRTDTVSVFEGSPFAPGGDPVEFLLKKTELLAGGGLRLVYVVKNNTD